MGMPMYALGVLPLIHKLDIYAVHQIWYADDACASLSLSFNLNSHIRQLVG